MRTALASKIALCVCPPALVATAVATVPPVRRTVHRLTAPHHPLAHHRPVRRVVAAPCGPGPLGGAPGALRTFASPGPVDDGPLFAPGSGGFSGPTLGDLPDAGGDYRTPATPGVSTPGGAVAPLGGGPGGGVVTPTPTPGSGPTGGGAGDTPAVPEPLVWALMLIGVGGAGSALRHDRVTGSTRRSRVTKAAAAADALSAGGASAGGVSAGAGGGAAAGSTKAALLAKAALCVCPPALLATGVATVPPVRHAVHAATAPRGLRPAAAAGPCAPVIAFLEPASVRSAIGAAAAPGAPALAQQAEAEAARPGSGGPAAAGTD